MIQTRPVAHARHAPHNVLSDYHATLLEVHRVCTDRGWIFAEVMSLVLDRWLANPKGPPPEFEADRPERKRRAIVAASSPARVGSAGRPRSISAEEMRARADRAAPDPGGSVAVAYVYGGRANAPPWALAVMRGWPEFRMSQSPCPGGWRWTLTRLATPAAAPP